MTRTKQKGTDLKRKLGSDKYPKAYQPWTREDDSFLIEKYNSGMEIRKLADLFQRKPSAITSRLKKLGLTN
jgi:hypothetical protein